MHETFDSLLLQYLRFDVLLNVQNPLLVFERLVIEEAHKYKFVQNNPNKYKSSFEQCKNVLSVSKVGALRHAAFEHCATVLSKNKQVLTEYETKLRQLAYKEKLQGGKTQQHVFVSAKLPSSDVTRVVVAYIAAELSKAHGVPFTVEYKSENGDNALVYMFVTCSLRDVYLLRFKCTMPRVIDVVLHCIIEGQITSLQEAELLADIYHIQNTLGLQ